MKLIKIKVCGKSEFKETMVDDDVYEWASKLSWKFRKDYVIRRCYKDGKRVELMMHRVILDAPKGMEVDHIDGNPLNNQRSNIRLCTRTENQRNKKKDTKKIYLSKYKGVTKTKNRLKSWIASITIARKRIYLGYYYTEEEAARAYDEAAKLHFKEFANLNFKE